jgi:predicted lactoylglutathione lyase
VESTTDRPTTGAHLSFVADTRDQVDEFFNACMRAGGLLRHAPRHWPEDGAYCAFASDPDDNNIEALHKESAD